MIPNVLRSRTELPQLQYPPPTTEPISWLAPPKLDVLKCRQCNNFNVRQLQAMQEHYRKSHGWVNPRSIGRPAEGLSSTDNVPWIEGVACQRFFPSREGSRWFQVNFKTERCNASALKAKRTPTKPQVAPRDLTSERATHLQQIMEREAGYQNALNQSYMTGNNASRETFAATSLCNTTVHDNRRTYATESEEDEEGKNADIEDWDPYEDDNNDDDSEDDDSEDDYDDSGY
ncbi:hypothetical protein FOXG_22180 [Fusarium oxysporum f. sp. lycopersici 4287]|uniref:Uncharacterized protein n=1 Tax=Fusarium oxysporum f. sp. lycopersici (strain 4287 / CBS 123668 / FGSC 9935 / NRRL 34936) TaxID=426428 RepID=A0A0J9W5Y9_FUSO4|nr:hypothetical protein FOXG_22046 [Fusarium oxysporum f. sp. lycopersici 4287]XP_018256338.1 uncharacterized protein FOXG_22180 [Fusarium oxysporum f. sp. lycopersici 4287]KAJ9419839.1 hypothetical protein QL093DRAFT_2015810 [Fusarium oxysporum]KNB17780.1 hypothetical protein FOXG_22046 [Fusarium oxysporum f. sp. lycopersici 4287]KNB18293.1 hypothetical protein FOXG_22180 [Fusarium oxysporum f. sp. lycopersici 4287]